MCYMRAKDRKQKFLFILFFGSEKRIDGLSALYSIKAPFEIVHADVEVIQFSSKSTVDPKYCLLAVDLF